MAACRLERTRHGPVERGRGGPAQRVEVGRCSRGDRFGVCVRTRGDRRHRGQDGHRERVGGVADDQRAQLLGERGVGGHRIFERIGAARSRLGHRAEFFAGRSHHQPAQRRHDKEHQQPRGQHEHGSGSRERGPADPNDILPGSRQGVRLDEDHRPRRSRPGEQVAKQREHRGDGGGMEAA